MENKEMLVPDNIVEDVKNFISMRTGIKFNDDKTNSLKELIKKRLEYHKNKVLPENYRLMLIDKSTDEYRQLLNRLTNHETYFFRNKTHFQGLKDFIIPQIIKRKKAEEEIIIWSAGSATGEEPYSLAMYLKEYFYDNNLARFKIFGTDISNEAVEKSMIGIFSRRSFRDPSNQIFMDKYFIQDGEFFKIKNDIKNMVIFQTSNLMDGEYPLADTSKKIDLILCRNVFIYFDHDSIRRVTDKFYNILHDDGFLIVGHSEAINQITDKFQPMILGDTFVFQKTITKKSTDSFLKQLEVRPLSPEIVLKSKELDREKEKIKESRELRVGLQIEDRLFEEALEDFNYEHFNKALEKVEGLLKINPKNEYGIILKANILANERKYDWSERLCKEVLEINPINEEAYFLLGIICIEKEDFTSAIKYFKQVLFLNPNCGYGYFELAFSFQQLRLYSESLTNYQNAITVLKSNSKSCFKTFRGIFDNIQLIDFCNFNINQIKKVYRG
ncbi:MAG: tetratricopeptide repeat protein [bacterium]|nr:tetratricopeptide repeat protein [bacterium]